MARPRTRDAELGRRFIDAAVRIVLDDGVAALTTRRVSDVSASNIAALNQLFGSREGLIDAVMAVGFERLVEAVRPRLDGRGGRERLREFSIAYREFARDHPTLIDVMLARPLQSGPSVDLSGAFECRAILVGAVRDVLPSAERTQAEAVALGFGALVEGLAMNERHRLLGSADAADRVWAVAIDGALAGMPRA